jgi:class 3 adenylate cyclase/DNA-binding transcriptional MerR regulator
VVLEDLAERAGVAPEQIEEWERLGLLPRSDDGSPAPDALERARLLRYATERGIRAEDIAKLTDRTGDVLARYVELLGGPRGPSYSLAEAARLAGVEETVARRLRIATGASADGELFEDDVESLRRAAVALRSGFPADALVQVGRVWGDALSRVADAESRLFHFYVHERLRAEGLSDKELVEATNAISDDLLGLIEPQILYFHRKGWERALREDLLMHLAADVAPPGGPVGQMSIAVLFIDLVGFTPLTEAMGDSAAAEVLDRFSELVRDTASRCDGRVVKQIGDEFMLVFPHAPTGLACGLEIADRAAAELEFPALRIGAHAGPALYREADYHGTTVITASRVVEAAERGEFVATEQMRRVASEIDDVRWTPLGRRRLKGLREPVELYAVRRDGAQRRDRVVDPVCEMAIDPAAGDLHHSWRGREYHFCSPRCRDLFVAAPGHYTTAA